MFASFTLRPGIGLFIFLNFCYSSDSVLNFTQVHIFCRSFKCIKASCSGIFTAQITPR
jgi:hypothetical protein